ncbi:N-acetylmuramoyl-L-alanine amidase, partial [Candidatus Pelagibacter sp.]|nr:N-acetylmuramoyl-L-alanine amidase [Candidatus Pelagibacter sp.]
MWPKITLNYSPNLNVKKRSYKSIKYIIIHYTGMKKELLAINRLCNIKSKVSAHFFIKKNGALLNLVPPLYEAWHAGRSSWKNLKSLNKYSIGIEIQNPGHDNNYENFS